MADEELKDCAYLFLLELRIALRNQCDLELLRDVLDELASNSANLPQALCHITIEGYRYDLDQRRDEMQ